MQPFGAEGQARIARHRKMRAAKKFSTIECYTNLKEVELEPGSDVLLECMSNLVANEMYMESGAGCHADQAILEGIRELNQQCSNLVIVTNEVFSESVPEFAGDERNTKGILGRINCEIAAMADQVTEVIYGNCTAEKGNGYDG